MFRIEVVENRPTKMSGIDYLTENVLLQCETLEEGLQIAEKLFAALPSDCEMSFNISEVKTGAGE